MQLSVVICTYNYAHFLRHALRALAAQTFSDFELVIVDDGSTDETEGVVKGFSGSFPHLVYLKKVHSGLADSRNVGIRTASGSHVAFLDADDLWSPQYLSAVQTVFSNEPKTELAVSDGARVHSSGEIKGGLFPTGLPPLRGPIGTARDLFYWFPFAAPSATTFSKSLYSRVGGFDPKLPNGAEDWHWFIRAAKANAFCVRIDHKLVIYRLHDANLSSVHWEEMFHGWLAIYSELLTTGTFGSDVGWYARRMTYPRVVRMAAHYGGAHGRMLINRTKQAFGNDLFLQTTMALTYLGLCRLAGWGRKLKRTFKGRGNRTVIDLNASPKDIFEEIAPSFALEKIC
jgi:glycosyltransferase involved in cell wall biosynthesis